MDSTVQTVITVIAVGVVLGIFKGVEWLMNKQRQAQPLPPQNAFPDESTGKVSTITCSKLRDSCSPQITGLSERVQAQAEQVQEIRESAIRIEADLRTLASDLKLAMIEATEKALKVHERRYHDVQTSTSDSLSQPYLRRDTKR